MDKTFSPNFDLKAYSAIREQGLPWMVRENKGLIAVWGGEAVRFLDGLVTNSIERLEDGGFTFAAFPNSKGRMTAVVRVDREADRYVFQTEPATYDSLLANLERFTFAGDFFVEDLSAAMEVISIHGGGGADAIGDILGADVSRAEVTDASFEGSPLRCAPGTRMTGIDVRLDRQVSDEFAERLASAGAVIVEGPLAELLRIESGIPRFGTDMDEETVVPEIALDGLISYEKGCYIGQEVIARIHFRGKVAKELKGVIFEAPEALVNAGDQLVSTDGKNAGFITSKAFSPKLRKHIALAYIRSAYLEPGTELMLELQTCRVADLPFIE